tara:strand:+ start:88 stop:525 length:438 start_codon:yes stop_codon:yes gene_type:complete
MKKLVLLLFVGFLIGCSSNRDSENNEEVEEKEWVLSEESVMGYDSLTKNYEFVGEWRMDIKMGTMNETLYYEYYNSNDENLYYLVTKENSMTIYEKKRDGNKYWGLNKDEWVVFDENGDRISYDREGLMSKEDLKSYGITYTKIR